MKIVELLNNLRVPITNEESDILGKFDQSPSLSKNQLGEREQYLADSLVNKDILIRNKHNGKIYYRKNTGI